MTDKELIGRIRRCRPADLSDGMDAIGLVNMGTMSSRMRPLRPGIKMAGFAYTVRYVPAQKPVNTCSTFEEYRKELTGWTQGTPRWKGTSSYKFGIIDGAAKDKDYVLVIDMGGYPGGLIGSDNAMNYTKNGIEGIVIDGACRDSYETNLEKMNVWCTARTFNHVYGRLALGGISVPVECAGVSVNPGDVVCGDDDGVLVIPRDRAEEVLTIAERVLSLDQKSRARHYRDLGYQYDETLGGYYDKQGID